MARIAFIIDDLFEDSEFRVPYDRLSAAGHEVVVVGLERGKQVEGKKKREKVHVSPSGARRSRPRDRWQ